MIRKILNIIFTVNILLFVLSIYICQDHAKIINHGSALFGKIENGHYYVGHYGGNFQEVKLFDWYADFILIIMVLITTIILFISIIYFFYVMFFETMLNKIKDSKDPLKKNSFKW